MLFAGGWLWVACGIHNLSGCFLGFDSLSLGQDASGGLGPRTRFLVEEEERGTRVFHTVTGCKRSHLFESGSLYGLVSDDFHGSGRESCPGHGFSPPKSGRIDS